MKYSKLEMNRVYLDDSGIAYYVTSRNESRLAYSMLFRPDTLIDIRIVQAYDRSQLGCLYYSLKSGEILFTDFKKYLVYGL